MLDPRASIINERLRPVRRIVAVSSGKGGVGKSLVASTLALLLARRSFSVGLVELDFTSPSTHLILGVDRVQPVEDRGLVPAFVHGLKYMSIVAYSGDRALPLRGADFSNALIELFAVTRWDATDFLVLDMPPGISDAVLDMLRLVERAEFLIVTTSSLLAFETVRKLAELLRGLNVPVLGILENMKMREDDSIKRKVKAIGLPYLGGVPFDPMVEEAIGRVDALLETAFARSLNDVLSRLNLC
jgi:ATP-binding protein involved in chromosome partitioning